MHAPISGITFVHNGAEFDYCFEASILSMLAVCDEVVCVEASSTDGTLSRLQSLQRQDARLRLLSAPWTPAPLVRATNTDWTKDLAEIARTAATHPVILYVQADEVLHEKDTDEIRRLAHLGQPCLFRRLNFWIDPWHLVPPGRVCGHQVCRLALKSRAVTWGSEGLEDTRATPASIDLFHYGFIRNASAFRKKSEIMQKNFMGVIDPIIYEAEKRGIQHLRHAWPESELRAFSGSHPQAAHSWLAAHGYTLSKKP